MNDRDYEHALNAVEYQMRSFYIKADAAGRYAEQYRQVNEPVKAAIKDGEKRGLKSCGVTLERLLTKLRN